MWEAGSAKTAAATAVLSRRPVQQRSRLAVCGVRTGSDAASVFRASRRGGARGPVNVAGRSGEGLVSRQRDPGTYVDET